MIRFVLIVFTAILLGIYSLFDLIIFYIINSFDKKIAIRYRHYVIKVVFKIFIIISGAKLNIMGIQNLKSINEPILIISNHRGFFDIISGYTLFDFPCGMVSKDSLIKVPILGYWMKKIDCVVLDRNDLRSGAMMIIKSIENLKNGISMWICPEGTRNRNIDPTELLEFKAGAFKIAEKTKCQILPIAFVGTEKVFEEHLPKVTPADVYINIGEPIKIGAESSTELSLKTYDEVKKLVGEILNKENVENR